MTKLSKPEQRALRYKKHSETMKALWAQREAKKDEQSEYKKLHHAEIVDMVNHPPHYTHGKIETIDAVKDITQFYKDGAVAYCVGNVIRYLARAPHKEGEYVESLRKAKWYLDHVVEMLSA